MDESCGLLTCMHSKRPAKRKTIWDSIDFPQPRPPQDILGETAFDTYVSKNTRTDFSPIGMCGESEPPLEPVVRHLGCECHPRRCELGTEDSDGEASLFGSQDSGFDYIVFVCSFEKLKLPLKFNARRKVTG